MKIFLTGASGLVGSAVARAADRRGHRVVGVVGHYNGELEGLAKRRSLDLTDEAATSNAVMDESPEAIINCAAVSVPEACEADPVRSEVLNVAVPSFLARLAALGGARFLHLSSEQVFNGRRSEPYSPGDPVSPINVYGRQKVASERAVRAAGGRAVTLRAPLLMGNSPAGRRSLHERLLADWAAGRTPKLFTDELRQPCTADNLAEVMLELCERDGATGVFHWAGSELVSRFELGRRIRAHFRLSDVQAPLAVTTYADVAGTAERRQACLALDLEPLAAQVKTRPEPLAAQLPGLHVPVACREWYYAAVGNPPGSA